MKFPFDEFNIQSVSVSIRKLTPLLHPVFDTGTETEYCRSLNNHVKNKYLHLSRKIVTSKEVNIMSKEHFLEFKGNAPAPTPS